MHIIAHCTLSSPIDDLIEKINTCHGSVTVSLDVEVDLRRDWDAVQGLVGKIYLSTTDRDVAITLYCDHSHDDVHITLPQSSDNDNPQSHVGRNEYSVVAVGGTFDHLHIGHRILLTMTCLMASKRVVVGLTGPALLKNKKYADQMQDYNTRKMHVERFIERVKEVVVEVVEISDPAGPTATDGEIEALVASKETEPSSDGISAIRKENGLPPLEFWYIDVVGESGVLESMEGKLSSTTIRQKLSSL